MSPAAASSTATDTNQKGLDAKTFLIVGGGAAGLTVASQLLKQAPKTDEVVVVEPSSDHYYQPMWTLVGGGIYPKENSRRDEAAVMPQGVKWVKQRATEFQPEANKVKTELGDELRYDYLVVASGIEPDLDQIAGLREAMNDPKSGVTTIYDYKGAERTWENIKNLRNGVALFTFPSTPTKCAGAPMKIMWLAEDYFRNYANVRDAVKVVYATPLQSMFAIPKYAAVLNALAKKRDVDVQTGHRLVAINSQQKEAIFADPSGAGEKKPIKYDMLHVGVPMKPIPAVAASPLAAANGYVDVDQHTLRHKKYANVFALGDAANLPTSKTAAGITLQAPALVSNMLAAANRRPLREEAKYDGYTSCPIVVSRDELILAEFKYDGVVRETFPWDQSKPSRFGMLLKKHVFPVAYWHGLLKGRWYGPSTIFNPFN